MKEFACFYEITIIFAAVLCAVLISLRAFIISLRLQISRSLVTHTVISDSMGNNLGPGVKAWCLMDDELRQLSSLS